MSELENEKVPTGDQTDEDHSGEDSHTNLPRSETRVKGAVDFLRWFRPEGPWELTSIVPDGRVTTQTFAPGKEEVLVSWLENKIGYENVYFHVNSIGDAFLTRKATCPTHHRSLGR